MIPDELCWCLGAYLLLSYTLLWRLFVRWEGLPPPADDESKTIALFMWVLFPLMVPGAMLMPLIYAVRWMSFLPIWIAFGGRKK